MSQRYCSDPVTVTTVMTVTTAVHQAMELEMCLQPVECSCLKSQESKQLKFHTIQCSQKITYKVSGCVAVEHGVCNTKVARTINYGYNDHKSEISCQ